MSRSVPRFPHGSSPQNACAICSSVVKCVFLACLFLFSRAFLLDSQGHLAFSRTNNRTGTFNAVPSDDYQDETLPLSWNPVLRGGPVAAINLTYHLGSDVYTPNPYRQTLVSESAAAANEANGTKQTSSTARSGNNTNSLETNSTMPVSLSSAIHDLAPTQHETPHNPNPGQEGYSIADNIINSVLSKSAANSQTLLSKENVVPLSEEDLDKLEEEPFFSLEEFDGDGEIFALKIWVNKKEHLRAKLGEVDYCQASSGIKCLSDN